MQILQWPDEILAGVSTEVVEIDDKIRILAAQMFETMVKQNGVGLAAPQVGVPLRIIVGGGPHVPWRFALVNPEIVKSSDQLQNSPEGCLSFKGRGTVNVKRPKRIKVRGWDMKGDESIFKCDGLLACVLCHEIDHLDGITLHHKGIGDASAG